MKKIILIAVFICAAVTSFSQSKTTTKTSSVSISNSDHDYSMHANFDSSKEGPIKKLVDNLVGAPGKLSETNSTWKLDDVYTITLTAKRLTIELDKDKASGALVRSFVKLGKDIQQQISRTDQPADEMDQ
ncbi:hypothetical protein INP83_12760 [Mucilaginibacter sp. 21P]|uniref:hypothetical protein n=1 Tax=Mucilaginibacter sp. 21P TaxID=2778902 RepID=UPI001C59AAC6|nr:hypothetical protein [Mucilaginibacter sp. 21P]QXV63970.1 hypothetical protein INP83_12760 [Mucilaginibacter sp. 21P]